MSNNWDTLFETVETETVARGGKNIPTELVENVPDSILKIVKQYAASKQRAVLPGVKSVEEFAEAEKWLRAAGVRLDLSLHVKPRHPQKTDDKGEKMFTEDTAGRKYPVWNTDVYEGLTFTVGPRRGPKTSGAVDEGSAATGDTEKGKK